MKQNKILLQKEYDKLDGYEFYTMILKRVVIPEVLSILIFSVIIYILL